MGHTRPAIDGGEHLREDAVPCRGVVDPRHPRDVRVHGSEGDEDSQECDDCPTVGAEGVRHHRGKGGDPAPDQVRPGADRDERDGEIEATNQDHADHHAAMEVPLRIPEFLRDVRGVLVPQVGPDNEGGRRADRRHPIRQKGRVVGGRDSRRRGHDGNGEGDEDGGHGGDLHAPREADSSIVDDERRDEDACGDEEDVQPGQRKDKTEVGRRRDGRRRGAQDRPRQKEPSGRRPRVEADAVSREGVDASGFGSLRRELGEGVGERIARERQQRPRDDRGGARDPSRKSRDDEDARSEERTDIDGDRVAEGDHTAQGRRGSRTAFLDRLQCGAHRGRFIEFLFITLPLGASPKTEVSVFGCTDGSDRLPGTRTLAATLFVSLDGVVESPEKWSFPFWSEETQKFKFDETFASDALLLGRVTYEGFAAAWPGRKDPDGFADRFNSMPKYVASRTLTKLAWNNSHLIQGDLAAEVSTLKQQPGRDIVIHGSPGLIRSLLPHGLIDEFRLLVYPLVLGRGKRLFDEGSEASLKLVESTTFSKGGVTRVYRPADKAGRAKQRETARPKRNTKRRRP